MHELALTDKILKLVLTEAETHHAIRINKIKIIIGELSGIVDDSVEFYFHLIAKNTIAGHAKLEFKRAGARLFCGQCNKEFTKEPRDFQCPDCGNLARMTGIGQECMVESIEVD